MRIVRFIFNWCALLTMPIWLAPLVFISMLKDAFEGHRPTLDAMKGKTTIGGLFS